MSLSLFKRGLFAFSLVLALGTPIYSEEDSLKVDLVVNPAERLTTDWVFVIDNSDSMQDHFARVRRGFEALTQFPTDKWHFSIVMFSHATIVKKLDWRDASIDSFRTADHWVNEYGKKQPCVNSYVSAALTEALHDTRPKLTVVLISDGGFTEACQGRGFDGVKETIRQLQKWRQDNKLNPAIICTVGIENVGYSAGGKPSNAACQQAMRDIGEEWRGGYVYIHPKSKKVP